MVRLYLPVSLRKGEVVPLLEDQLHYLRSVLRLSVGDELDVFNGEDGQWRARLLSLSKSKGEVLLETQTRIPQPLPFVGLIFSPLKHDPQLYLIEKATELGVSILQPVILERTVVHRFNAEKMQKNAIEASQQCERLAIPDVREISDLRRILDDIKNQKGILIVCQERGQPVYVSEILSQIPLEVPLFFLIGPEGGISEAELSLLSRESFVRFAHLGPLILRAETAALYALVMAQANRLKGLQGSQI